MPYKTKELRHLNYVLNKEKQLAQGKEWSKNNRSKRREHYKKWADNNKEKNKARRKAYYEKHKESEKLYAKIHKPKDHRAKVAEWKKANPHRVALHFANRKARVMNAGGKLSAEEWFILCFVFGFRCACCKEVNKLTPDHIIPVSRGGSSWLWNIQPLCMRCNSAKNINTVDYRERIEIVLPTNEATERINSWLMLKPTTKPPVHLILPEKS